MPPGGLSLQIAWNVPAYARRKSCYGVKTHPHVRDWSEFDSRQAPLQGIVMALTRVDYDFKLQVTKTIEVGVSGAQDPTANVETATKAAGYLTPNTSPAVVKEWLSARTLSGTS